MPKKIRNLFGKITQPWIFDYALYMASKGKSYTSAYLEFKEYSALNLENLRQAVIDGSYQPSEFRQFTVYEPKARLISAPAFNDRIVQHALHFYLNKAIEPTLLPNTYACRNGKGTHAGVRYIQASLRRHNFKYFLKTDYSKFFPSIDCNILLDLYDRKIGCSKTMDLLKKFVLPDTVGIPIGSLISQLSANLYGSMIDNHIHHTLKQRHWARYMDDIVILGNDIDELRDIFYDIESFSKDRMKLSISKWQCSSVDRGINFLGFRIWKTHKLIRKDSVKRAKKKIKGLNTLEREMFISSWNGHIKHADCSNLVSSILR